MSNQRKDPRQIAARAQEAGDKQRENYINRACGDNDDLKDRVHQRIDDKRKHAETKHSPSRSQQGFVSRTWNMAREHSTLSLTLAGAALAVLVLFGTGAGITVWAYEAREKAEKDKKEAVEKQKKAEHEEHEYKSKYQRSEESRKELKQQLEQVKDEKKYWQQTEKNKQSVLDFLRSTLLSASRPSEISLAEAYWKEAMQEPRDVSLRQAVESAATQVGNAFPDRPLAEVMAREIIGAIFLNLGEPALAVPQYEQALQIREAIQGLNSTDAANCRNQLAIACRLAGRTTQAARLFEQNRDSESFADALDAQGKLLLLQKKPAEAELKLRQSLSFREANAPDQATTYEVQMLLGTALLEQQKYDQAEPYLLSAYQGLHALGGGEASPSGQNLHKTLERLVDLYTRWGRLEKLDYWAKELESSPAPGEQSVNSLGGEPAP